jgi:hypothetical protein
MHLRTIFTRAYPNEGPPARASSPELCGRELEVDQQAFATMFDDLKELFA